MSRRAKWQMVIGIFSLCWMLYFLLPCLSTGCAVLQNAEPFDSEPANFVFLTMLFLAVAVVATDLLAYGYRQARRLPWFQPRLGEVLVTRGFVSREELSTALEEQKLKTGEVLLRAGQISSRQLASAMDYQKKCPSEKMGEILLKLGYATEQQVRWALDQINRKLGKVLVERGLITDSDLRRVLGRIRYSRYR